MYSLLIALFVLGYLGIALEHTFKINKAATALLLGVLCWMIYVLNVPQFLSIEDIPESFRLESVGEVAANIFRNFAIEEQFLKLTGEIAYILFFLMGAMTIVELVDAHEGFALITDRIQSRSKVRLLWIVGWLTFFMSSVLDNLTTTIVMISLLRKLIGDRETRLYFVGLVVIAANAGGAWTVIGDVTTTMLWIKHKIDTVDVMQQLFLSSVVCLLAPLIGLSFYLKGTLDPAPKSKNDASKTIERWHQILFLFLGLVGLLSVPALKAWTHLPPFAGMMLSLGVMWVVSELTGKTMDEQTRSSTGVLSVLKRVDMSSILFFLGILLAVGALSSAGILGGLARQLDSLVPSHEAVATIIGLVSAVVDNVPLVAAGIEMYQFEVNHKFWMLLAYCAGTGGSCLIIGSAAGVAAMGLEHIDFVWYLRRISPWALLGYFAGIGSFLLEHWLLG